MDCLIAERIVYTKSQEAENLTKDIHHDDSTNSERNVNYVNYELIDFDTCLTHDSQEDIDFRDDVAVLIEFIEGKVENYSTELSITYAHGEVDFQSTDECEKVELKDIPLRVINEQEIEEYMQEEVVSDRTLPEMYSADVRIHTDIQLETPIIKSEETCVIPSDSKLVQDMTLIHDASILLHTIGQLMTEQKISLCDRAILDRLIPIAHATGEKI